MNERLKAIRLSLNLSQEEFGSNIGIKSRAHISALESGARNITDRIISDVCREYGVREEWLRSGTGDIFSAILAADAVNGVSFEESVKKASGFIKKCILSSIEREIPLTDGVCFEEHLGSLAR